MEVNLSQSQEQAAGDIRALLRRPTTGGVEPLVAIHGLSGVGKDTLWSVIQDEFSDTTFVDYHSMWQLKEPEVQRRYVTTVIPAETTRLKWPKDIHLVTVRGMTEEEIRDYISERAEEGRDIEKIVQQSLGIPLLASNLLSRQFTDEEADLLVGTHLASGWDYRESRSDIMKYLQMRPSANVARIFRNSDSYRYFFHDLPKILRNYEALRRKGVELNSPFFQAKNSYAIFEAQELGDYGTITRILAPNISQADYETIRYELLPEGETTEIYGGSDRSEKSRFQVFRTSWRKVEIYLVPEDKTSEIVDIRYMDNTSASDGLDNWRRFELNELQLPESFTQDQSGSFFIFAHEHAGQPNLNVAWLAESLLQNLGVPYIVSHGGRDTYLYNPGKKLMEPVAKK